eukprot:TRINITY_DN27154_c0_g1_i1.p2 TRINITY_DN27154_c0_g1~~TRINITY_DN27154_c0_g1_i1.p2  ORF type:complete len:367 (+),score=123.48 TRINITY_DN27154_c0_g1_i1:77-1177(+)
MAGAGQVPGGAARKGRRTGERSCSPPRSKPLGRGGQPLAAGPPRSPPPAAADGGGAGARQQAPAEGSPRRLQQELQKVTRELGGARRELQRWLRTVDSLEAEQLRCAERLQAARERDSRRRREQEAAAEAAEAEAAVRSAAAAAAGEELRREAADSTLRRQKAERDLMAVRADLLRAGEERDMLRLRDTSREGALSALRAQLDDAERALGEERRRGEALAAELREHDALALGHPVVGVELSEGAPYDIAGVWVVSVVAGGPADLCGIRRGDVISEVAGVPVPTREAFRAVVDGGEIRARPGQQLSFRVHRDGSPGAPPEQRTLMLTLGWSARRPEGKRVITVQRASPRRASPRRPAPSPSPARDTP